MKISLRKKKLATGLTSLYLEYYMGSSIDNNGKKKHNRRFEYLKLYLHGEPTTAIEKKENKEALQLAQNILTLKNAELIKGKFNIEDTNKGKTPFLEFYNKLKDDRYESKSNYDNWEAALKHIERYCLPHLKLKDVDGNFVKGFKNYLQNEARTIGGSPLSQNTKYTYFNKFKAVLRGAFNEGYLKSNVLKSVKGFNQGESKREYLTHSELQALSIPILKFS